MCSCSLQRSTTCCSWSDGPALAGADEVWFSEAWHPSSTSFQVAIKHLYYVQQQNGLKSKVLLEQLAKGIDWEKPAEIQLGWGYRSWKSNAVSTSLVPHTSAAGFGSLPEDVTYVAAAACLWGSVSPRLSQACASAVPACLLGLSPRFQRMRVDEFRKRARHSTSKPRKRLGRQADPEPKKFWF